MTSKHLSYWWDCNPPDFCYQTQLPDYADVVIIGAGFAGLTTAYWLARFKRKSKKPYRVLVIDEAPHPAAKASGRHSGAIYLGSNRTPNAVVKQMGIRAATQLYRYSLENNQTLFRLVAGNMNCGMESNGGIRVATTAKDAVDLDASHEFLNSKLGIASARFDQNQSQHLVIMPNSTGSLYMPFEGMFDPFALCNNLARLIRTAANINITYGAFVDTAGSNQNGPFVLLSNGHIIQAGSVVHATTKTLSELQDHIVYKREHVVRTSPFGEELADMMLPLMPIEIGTDSVRLNRRSVIMTGGKNGLRKDVEIGVIDDSGFNERIFKNLTADMSKHFPFTNLVELTHSWTYVDTSTDDQLPLMGVLSTPGHYVNAAHGRNKFGLAFLGSKHIAEDILGLKSDNADFGIFSPSRFTRGDNVQTV